MNGVKNVQKGAQNTKIVKAVKPTTVTKKTAEKEPTAKDVLKVIQETAPTAEERILRAKNFTILTEKYEHLKEKKQEIDQFKLSSDGTKEKIVLSNAQGYTLEVGNSKVIQDTVKLLTDTLSTLLDATKKEVEEFAI